MYSNNGRIEVRLRNVLEHQRQGYDMLSFNVHFVSLILNTFWKYKLFLAAPARAAHPFPISSTEFHLPLVSLIYAIGGALNSFIGHNAGYS